MRRVNLWVFSPTGIARISSTLPYPGRPGKSGLVDQFWRSDLIRSDTGAYLKSDARIGRMRLLHRERQFVLFPTRSEVDFDIHLLGIRVAGLLTDGGHLCCIGRTGEKPENEFFSTFVGKGHIPKCLDIP